MLLSAQNVSKEFGNLRAVAGADLAIALAIAHERSDARVTATDISPGALALAAENASRSRRARSSG